MWNFVSNPLAEPIKQAPGVRHSTEKHYLKDYRKQYLRDNNPSTPETLSMWINEILCEFDPGSSLLIFGSGHPIHANTYKRDLDLERIVCMDVVEEAGGGLEAGIEFWPRNILIDEIEEFDYIFSTHTIEHFTRDEVMNVILPKCVNHARKAVVFLMPYKDIGWGPAKPEGPHLLELSENDELAAQALKWRRVRHHFPNYGIELVLWFEGKA